MSLRTRLAVATAAAVALAVFAATALGFVVDRSKLRGQIDDNLKSRSAQIQTVARYRGLTPLVPSVQRILDRLPPPQLGGPTLYAQVIDASGRRVVHGNFGERLPVTERDKAVATGRRSPFFSDETVGGTHLRTYVFPVGHGLAVELARPLTEVDEALSEIKVVLFVIALVGTAFAAVLGVLVAETTLRPVRRLTRDAEEIAGSQDLHRRTSETRSDELGRLAHSFNLMLDALEQTVTSQRQLVADASHELRTPLTSIQTNLEVLALDESMPLAERRELVDAVLAELHEMRTLVAELVELARGESAGYDREIVRFDLIAKQAVERFQRDRPYCELKACLEPTLVLGDSEALERVVLNLLDNARKWSPDGALIEVSIRDGTLRVRDHGSGIAEQDLPLIFERFYRAASAREAPGSGLGLAIVKQIVESHGGNVTAAGAPGGGTTMTVELPVSGWS